MRVMRMHSRKAFFIEFDGVFIEPLRHALVRKGLAELDADGRGRVTSEGLALRARIEDDTDRLTTLPWELLGEERSIWFAERFEPPCEALLARVDATAGTNYQPASRLHD